MDGVLRGTAPRIAPADPDVPADDAVAEIRLGAPLEPRDEGRLAALALAGHVDALLPPADAAIDAVQLCRSINGNKKDKT